MWVTNCPQGIVLLCSPNLPSPHLLRYLPSNMSVHHLSLPFNCFHLSSHPLRCGECEESVEKQKGYISLAFCGLVIHAKQHTCIEGRLRNCGKRVGMNTHQVRICTGIRCDLWRPRNCGGMSTHRISSRYTCALLWCWAKVSCEQFSPSSIVVLY